VRVNICDTKPTYIANQIRTGLDSQGSITLSNGSSQRRENDILGCVRNQSWR